MTQPTKAQTRSYQRHATQEAALNDPQSLPPCFTRPNSVDAWRHRRMHDLCKPLIEDYPQSQWMTIGDGHFGSDAHYFKEQGQPVLATSLTDVSLKVAKKMGFIDNIASINAENIDLEDESQDFTYCKEAYHHFPQPPVAFYHMLRVASKGCILVEPKEQRTCLLGFIKKIAKKILWHQPPDFERGGNFIYRVAPAEMIKLMSASGYEGCVAFKFFNDFYHPRLSAGDATKTSFKFFLERTIIGLMNLLCHLGLMDYALVMIIAFKNTPSESTRTKLKKNGFKITPLAINPFKE